jgi:hypothetical protein
MGNLRRHKPRDVFIDLGPGPKALRNYPRASGENRRAESRVGEEPRAVKAGRREKGE